MMWSSLAERMPNALELLCMLLAFVVPYFVYKINQQLHKHGDPPWKKAGTDDKKNGEG
ncbi:hypothetical protein [Thalassobacillus devorans]|uniref:hypothetical protein n=1 Tax=Thalassobacillus devorans TaxID=279813 RepID=UPI00190F37B6|nr:hypothetical protein [Thalassobacillus devorans]